MNDDDLAQLISEAQSLIESGQTVAARAALEKILAARPDSADAHFLLAVVSHDSKDLEGAVRHFQSFLRERPDVAEVHFNIGTLLSQLSRNEDAIAAFSRALELDPEMVVAHNNLGVLFRAEGKLQQARECFERAVAAAPNYGPAMINLGLTLTKLREAELSQDADDRLSELRPNLADALYAYSTELERVGKSVDSGRMLEEALELQPDSPVRRFHLAAKKGLEPPPTAPPEYVTELFGRYAAQFDDHLRNRLQYRAPEQIRAAAGEVAGDRVFDILDLGCGTGLCGELFRSVASRLTGIDLCPEMIQEATKRGCYDELRVQSISDCLTDCRTQWDLILSADVFIYVGDLSECFTQVAGALRDGGLFAFSVEAADNSTGEAGQNVGFRLESTRRYTHTLSYLRRLAAHSGFVERVSRRETLRSQADKDVVGWIVVFEKPQIVTSKANS